MTYELVSNTSKLEERLRIEMYNDSDKFNLKGEW